MIIVSLMSTAACFAETAGVSVSVDVIRLANEGFLEIPVVSGLSDAALEKEINALLRAALTSEAVLMNTPDSHIEGKLSWAIIEGKLLSAYVTEYVNLGELAAYPRNDVLSVTVNLETGGRVFASDVLIIDEDLRAYIRGGVFKLTNVDAEAEGAAEEFIGEFINNYYPDTLGVNFYMTREGVALYIKNVPHALGDYWVFEAAWRDIRDIVRTEVFE
jgi:hypothetical protein